MAIKRMAALLMMVLVFLSACADLQQTVQGSGTQPQSIATSVNGVGTIASIEQVPRAQGLGLGALAGAAVGGVLGNQIGGGLGNTAATVAGAAGGAYVGHQLEKSRSGSGKIYKVTIHMDDGSTQSFAQEAKPTVKAGDRVSISHGVLSPL